VAFLFDKGRWFFLACAALCSRTRAHAAREIDDGRGIARTRSQRIGQLRLRCGGNGSSPKASPRRQKIRDLSNADLKWEQQKLSSVFERSDPKLKATLNPERYEKVQELQKAELKQILAGKGLNP
jgi:hypothetical protein